MPTQKDKYSSQAAKHKTELFARRICEEADKEGLETRLFFDDLMLAYVAVASSIPDSMGSCAMHLSACAGDLLKKHASRPSEKPATYQ